MNNRHLVSISAFSLLLILGLAACLRSRSDAEIAADVQMRISADSKLAARQITVQSETGVVALSGNVSSTSERTEAGNVAKQVAGVKRLVNNLQVVTAAVTQEKQSKPSAYVDKTARTRKKAPAKTKTSQAVPPTNSASAR